MRSNLHTDPAVFEIASRVGQNRWEVVGRLSALWAWADGHSADGQHLRVSSVALDSLVETPGFADAMRAVGWLSGRDGDLCFPKWERHNGASAKARALEAEAKRLRRMSGNLLDTCPTESGQNVGPEKRRGERSINTKPPTLRERAELAAAEVAAADAEVAMEAQSMEATAVRAGGMNEEAVIPAAEEVVAFGGTCGVPEEYCRHYHGKTTETHNWITKGGKLIQWRMQLARWWAGDRPGWEARKQRQQQQQNQKTNHATKSHSHAGRISPANANNANAAAAGQY